MIRRGYLRKEYYKRLSTICISLYMYVFKKYMPELSL